MKNQTSWYKTMTDGINKLAEDFGLDGNQTSDLRNYILCVAREQYKMGNKAGAEWAFKQAKN